MDSLKAVVVAIASCLLVARLLTPKPRDNPPPNRQDVPGDQKLGIDRETLDLDRERFELEKQTFALDEKRFAIENSFLNKNAAAIIAASVAIVGTASTALMRN